VSTLFIPWLVFPAVLGVLSLSCGLLLERVAGLRLPGTLVVPCGFAVFALVAQMATASATTARLATPAVIAAAVAGFALAARARAFRRPDGWAAAAAIGAFAAYASPIVLSGKATFAGVIKLDDDSTLLSLLDRTMTHGRDISGLEPSTYLRVLDLLLIHGYPMATFMPLGVGRRIVGGDAIWLYQPTMAVMAAMLALALYELTSRLVASRALRAAIAFVAAQSALLYGYALWGGIKELGTAWAVPLLAAVVPLAVRSDRVRHLLPLAVVTALLLGVLNAGALPWVAPALLYAAVVIFRRRGAAATARAAGVFAAFTAVLALPSLLVARDFLHSNIVSFDPIANLVRPLTAWQLAGIWPAGDFRFDPSQLSGTRVLILVAIAAAVAGVVIAARRGAPELALYVVGAVASALALNHWSTPWIAGKAFATASPAIPLAALTAAVVLLRARRVVEGGILVVVLAGAVLWSNVLQYHDAWLAPRDQLEELSTIGGDFAGDSPSLITEYQPYGVRHFLRKLDPEGPAELRYRTVALRTGGSLDKSEYADLDAFRLDGILVYRTLILRRSPVESRPSSVYHLVQTGKWYEVWQRPDPLRSPVIEHLSLGDEREPGAVVPCAELQRLADLPGTKRLAAVVRPAVVSIDLGRAALPRGWTADRYTPRSVLPTGAGMAESTFEIAKPGRYLLWIGGSVRDRLDAYVDGRKLGTIRNQLNNWAQWTQLGSGELAPGRHTLTLRYHGPDLRPGSGGAQFAMGPVVLGTKTADLPVTYVEPSAAGTLCGKRLDWVEALAL
jgi:hypothetical protein